MTLDDKVQQLVDRIQSTSRRHNETKLLCDDQADPDDIASWQAAPSAPGGTSSARSSRRRSSTPD